MCWWTFPLLFPQLLSRWRAGYACCTNLSISCPSADKHSPLWCFCCCISASYTAANLAAANKSGTLCFTQYLVIFEDCWMCCGSFMYPTDIHDVLKWYPTSDTNVANASCTCKVETSYHWLHKTWLSVTTLIGMLLTTSNGELPCLHIDPTVMTN